MLFIGCMAEHTPYSFIQGKDVCMNKHTELSNIKLINFISAEIKDLFEKYLDYMELVTDDDFRLKQVRSKVLRNGNNSIRRITALIQDNFVVSYDPKVESEEVIKIKPIKVR